eukprot:scaffold21686_cov108-Isochrysis_galbana.AAC.1
MPRQVPPPSAHDPYKHRQRPQPIPRSSTVDVHVTAYIDYRDLVDTNLRTRATPITRRPSRSVHGLKYDNVIDTVADVIANVHAWCYVVGEPVSPSVPLSPSARPCIIAWGGWLGTTVNEAEPRKRQRGGCMRGVAKASGIGDAVEPFTKK